MSTEIGQKYFPSPLAISWPCLQSNRARGGPQGALLFQWQGGRWRTVDLDTWKKGFAKRLAPKYVGWRGVGYDFRHMTADSFLYAPGDAHARPSGYAKIRFTVAQGVLVLGDLNVGSSEPVFDAICRANPKCHRG